MHTHIFFYTRDPQGTLFFIDRYTDEVVTLIHALIEHELTESGCSYVPPPNVSFAPLGAVNSLSSF